jgi:hypothetical protein
MSEHNWPTVANLIESLDILTLEQIRLVQKKVDEELAKDYRKQQISEAEQGKQS